MSITPEQRTSLDRSSNSTASVAHSNDSDDKLNIIVHPRLVSWRDQKGEEDSDDQDVTDKQVSQGSSSAGESPRQKMSDSSSRSGRKSPRGMHHPTSRSNSGGGDVRRFWNSRTSETMTPHQRASIDMLNRSIGHSSFIVEDSTESGADIHPWRRALIAMLADWRTTALTTSAIIFNSVLMCIETDMSADYPGRLRQIPSEWVVTCLDICAVFFLLELIVRLYAERLEFFDDGWNWLDISSVVTSCLEYMLEWIGSDSTSFSAMRLLRTCRVLRVLRAVRATSALTELRQLVRLMGTCIRTLAWASLLLALVMTSWAIVAVEVLNPLVQEMKEQGYWKEDCERCPRAYASVWMSNLTFFQTLVAGDSWGITAMPIIEAHPWTVFIFAGSLLTLVFGILNLIIAVVVDTFADRRNNNVETLATEHRELELMEKKKLTTLFQRIDADCTGEVTLMELEQGARRVKEFGQLLRVLDIDRGDLHQLFSVLDADGSGDLDMAEFVEALYRMKHTKSPTAARLTKHMVTRLENRQSQFEDKISSALGQLKGDLKTVFLDQHKSMDSSLQAQKVEMNQAKLELERNMLQQENSLGEILKRQEAAMQLQTKALFEEVSHTLVETALAAAEQATKAAVARPFVLQPTASVRHLFQEDMESSPGGITRGDTAEQELFGEDTRRRSLSDAFHTAAILVVPGGGSAIMSPAESLTSDRTPMSRQHSPWSYTSANSMGGTITGRSSRRSILSPKLRGPNGQCTFSSPLNVIASATALDPVEQAAPSDPNFGKGGEGGSSCSCGGCAGEVVVVVGSEAVAAQPQQLLADTKKGVAPRANR